VAHALTAVRLALVLPTAMALARPGFLGPGVLFMLLWVAIATDYADGKVARLTGTASPRGQLFDHGTDFVFVTAGLTGAAMAGLVTPVLPVLITIAFAQYVLDSYWLYRQKQLRMSAIGRWNGILYFVPLVLISASRLALPGSVASWLTLAAGAAGYGLAVSTVVSAIDRAVAPLRSGRAADTLGQRDSRRNNHQ
jgi:phosphatidylglycerophosphate synthase